MNRDVVEYVRSLNVLALMLLRMQYCRFLRGPFAMQLHGFRPESSLYETRTRRRFSMTVTCMFPHLLEAKGNISAGICRACVTPIPMDPSQH